MCTSGIIPTEFNFYYNMACSKLIKDAAPANYTDDLDEYFIYSLCQALGPYSLIWT